MSSICIYRKGLNGRYEFDIQAFQKVLNKCKDNRVAIYSINGGLRMGKSFIMGFFIKYLKTGGKGDWISYNLDNTFKYRSGSVPETSGIWIWDQPYNVCKRDGSRISVLLMDTQGCFDQETSNQDNAFVFALSTLLSSVMIYNIQRQISEEILQFLQYFAGFARLQDEYNRDEPFQKLMFLVRDWEHPDYPFGFYDDNTSIDGKNYKKWALNPREGQPLDVKNCHDMVLNTFQNVSTYLMPHPGSNLARNGIFDSGTVDKEFLSHLKQFIPLMLNPDVIEGKKIGGQYITGHQLIRFAQKWSQMFKSESLPESKNLFQSNAELQHEMAKQNAVDYYNRQMDIHFNNCRQVSDYDGLNEWHSKLFKESKKLFKETKKLESNELFEQYMNIVVENINQLWNQFIQISESKRKELILKSEQDQLNRHINEMYLQMQNQKEMSDKERQEFEKLMERESERMRDIEKQLKKQQDEINRKNKEMEDIRRKQRKRGFWASIKSSIRNMATGVGQVVGGVVDIVGEVVGGVAQVVGQAVDKLPAVPLVVKNPYLSTWMSAPQLPGHWPTFWTGASRGFSGMVRVNDKTYQFMGSFTGSQSHQMANQTALKVTPTQSIFTFTASAVELTVNFFTPIDPKDLKSLSIPASYIAVNAISTDGNTHKIQVYFDISGEWSSGDLKQVIEWEYSSVANNVSNFDLRLKNQSLLKEIKDTAQWGTIKFFTNSGVTYEANNCLKMRTSFVKTGRLNNTIDKNFRPIDSQLPGIAFSREMTAGPKRSANVYYGIAHVRRPAISYTVGQFNQLWESYFDGNSNRMISYFLNDGQNALNRANQLDSRVVADAHRVGGNSYVKVVSAALRQAFGGIELVGTPDKPWMTLKEISSDGNCQTVDVIYPHFSVHYYLNPNIIKYLLDPLLDNQEKGFFPHNYSMHDLGTHYPRCIGHREGKEEAMEVEESANMLIMMSAYVRASGDKAFALKHYNIAKQWTKFLVDHGLITGLQLTTDDFLGKQINSTNLSVKAIVGIAGMAQLAEHVDKHSDQVYYRQIAESYAKQWSVLAEDPSATHIQQSYNSPNTWFLIYNLFADKLLDTKLFSQKVYKQQDEWYKSLFNKYGIPLRNGWPGVKYDWSFFSAAASQDRQFRQMVFNSTALYLTDRPVNSPFPDRNDDSFRGTNGHHNINRPAIGAIFAPLIVKN